MGVGAGLRAGCSFSSPLALAVHIFKNVNSITVDVTSCFSIGEKPAQAVKQTEPHQPHLALNAWALVPGEPVVSVLEGSPQKPGSDVTEEAWWQLLEQDR